jgi:hypothetical protein
MDTSERAQVLETPYDTLYNLWLAKYGNKGTGLFLSRGSSCTRKKKRTGSGEN